MTQEQVLPHIDQERLELAYVNAILDEELQTNERKLYPKYDLNIPDNHINDFDEGLYHNIALRLLLENRNFKYNNVSDGLSVEQIAVLRSAEFVDEFNDVEKHINSFSLTYLFENPSKEEVVVEYFLSAYSEYVDNLYDVNTLINRYIEFLENDNSLNERERSNVYRYLSVAAFSSYYWYDKYANDSKGGE